jgi:uncharacterized RDD family membrane protein YckC
MNAARPPAPATEAAGWPRPAGFWRRYLAYSLDWTVLAAPLWLLLSGPLARAWAAWQALNTVLQEWLLARVLAAPGRLAAPLALAREVLADPSLRAALGAASDRLSGALVQAAWLGAGAAALYFIGFEGSAWAATPGKRLLGLQVRAVGGQRLSWPRSALRFFAGSLSWLSLNLGHALAGWRRDRRALHDLVAGSQVLASGPMPGWGRGLLIAQALALLALFALVLGRLLWLLGQLSGAG